MKPILLALLLAAVFPAASQTNNALTLNGSSNFVSLGTPIPAGSSYSKEAWVFHTGTYNFRNIISSQNHPFWVDNGILKAGHNNDYGRVMDPVQFPMNRWVHVAMTYDASTQIMTLYRDGQKIAERSGVPALVGTEQTFISSHQGTQNFWHGKLDELRIWLRALTPEEIKRNMHKGPANNATGLISYFKCDQTGTTTLVNSCTNPGATTTASMTGGTFTASPVQHRGNALHFDGVNDYISLGGHSSLKPANAVTVELWARSPNWVVSSQQQLTSNFENGGYGITLANGNLNFAVRHSGNASYEYASIPQTTLTNGEWYHVAGTFDGYAIRLYVNGTLVNTNTVSATPRTLPYSYPGNHLLLGAEATDGAAPDGMYFQGEMDEVRVWNVARSAAQLSSNMNTELNPENAAQTTGLISYYTFNQGIATGDNTGMSGVVDLMGVNTGTLNNFTLNSAISNYTQQRTDLVLLPVILSQFDATAAKSSVNLHWSTAQEQNSLDYEIQHSIDAQSWVRIGSILAAGTSNTKRQYAFTHNEPVKGSNYYRLAQRDRDGRINYSEIKRVNFSAEQKAFVLQSNIVKSNQLQIQVNQPSTIFVYGTDGKQYLRKQLNTGTEILNLNLPVSGIYWLSSGTTIERIIVQ